MSVPGITTTIHRHGVACLLRQNLAVAKDFQPMSLEEMHQVVAAVKPVSGDGRFEVYKTSPRYEASSRAICTSNRSTAPTCEKDITAMPVPHRQLKGVSVAIIGVGAPRLATSRTTPKRSALCPKRSNTALISSITRGSITTGWWLPSIQAHLELAVDLIPTRRWRKPIQKPLGIPVPGDGLLIFGPHRH
jgi:hypothetical protein